MMISVRVFLGILLAAMLASPSYSQEQNGPLPAASATQSEKAPPATPTESSAPRPMRIRVGASVAASQLVYVVQLADRDPNKMSPIVTGTVVLHAVIDFDGTIAKLEFVSGPALLSKFAMDAVKQWRYRPTKLNGQPVQVDTTINVVFAVDKNGKLKPQPKNP